MVDLIVDINKYSAITIDGCESIDYVLGTLLRVYHVLYTTYDIRTVVQCMQCTLCRTLQYAVYGCIPCTVIRTRFKPYVSRGYKAKRALRSNMHYEGIIVGVATVASMTHLIYMIYNKISSGKPLAICISDGVYHRQWVCALYEFRLTTSFRDLTPI